MPSFSQATIMGHMVRDVEIRQAGDHDVGSFSVAVTKKVKDKETVSYFDCKAWNQQCKFIEQWFKKGDAILVTGEITQETWDDKETGAKRSKMVITVERATFAGGGGQRKQKSDDGEKQSYYSGRGMGRRDQRYSGRREQNEGSEQMASTGKDEIPF